MSLMFCVFCWPNRFSALERNQTPVKVSPLGYLPFVLSLLQHDLFLVRSRQQEPDRATDEQRHREADTVDDGHDCLTPLSPIGWPVWWLRFQALGFGKLTVQPFGDSPGMDGLALPVAHLLLHLLL